MPTHAEDPTAEVTDLLQPLIRNQCVNDGTVGSGEETRSVDLLARLPRRRGRPRDLRAAARAHEPGHPHRGHRSRRAVAPADGPHRRRAREPRRLEPRPVRRRDRRRLRVGPRRGRHAQPHRVAGGRVPPPRRQRVPAQGHADLPRGRRRGGAGRVGRATGCSTTSATRSTPTTCSPSRAGSRSRRRTGTRLPVLVGEKGTFWSKLRVRGTPGPRVAAVPHRQRARHRGRGGAPHRRVPSRETQIHDVVAPLRRRARTSIPSSPPRCSTPTSSTARSPELPLGIARHWHACTHTTFAPTVAHGGTKTNVIPDRVDLEVDIRTLPGQTGADAIAMLRDALGDLADAVEIESNDDPGDRRRRSTRRCGTRSARVSVAAVRGLGAASRRSWWAAPTTASTGAPARWATASGCSRSASPYEDYAIDVPRQRRTRRPGVARAVDAAVGSRRARPARRLSG